MSRSHLPTLLAPFLMLLSLGLADMAPAAGRPPNVIVIYTDDHGYADLGSMGIVNDVRTPHLDRLAREGARFTHGYVTAPICGPSRAGLLSGRYQQRMGFETHADFPLKLDSQPLAERLRKAGYRTGMTGKLHLPTAGAKGEDPSLWGFDEYWMKAGNFTAQPNHYLMTHDVEGKPIAGGAEWRGIEGMHRVETSNKFAVDFIGRNHDRPFFLYVAQFAPHVPLEVTEKYLSRFPKEMPEGRRYGLALIAAVDDGVGEILAALEKHGIAGNTLIFFAGDNGAPFENGQPSSELPVAKLKHWDGSVNTPLLGEKGLLAEGGIRVPFLAWGPGRVKPAQVIDTPVITLDIAATACALAMADAGGLDGTNISPLLAGKPMTALQERPLFWRFAALDAIRVGQWKLMRSMDNGDFLFDLSAAEPERENELAAQPERAAALAKQLDAWTATLGPRGIVSKAQRAATSRLMRTHFPEP